MLLKETNDMEEMFSLVAIVLRRAQKRRVVYPPSVWKQIVRDRREPTRRQRAFLFHPHDEHPRCRQQRNKGRNPHRRAKP